MTTEERKIVEDLGKSLNIPSEAMAEAFNEAGELQSIEPFTAALAERNTKAKAEREAQYSRGKKEALATLERSIREKYDADETLQGVELIEAVIQKQIEEVKGANPDDIEKHPAFQAKKREMEKQMNALKQQHEQEKQDLQKQFNKERTLLRVEQLAVDELINGYNPQMPSDEQKAAKWRQLFLNEIKAGNYLIDEDGSVVLTDENGEPKTDNVGKVITFKDHVHGIASSYFEKATEEKRKAPGGKTTPPKPGTVEVPKDDNEFARKMGELKTPEERAELSRLYRESKQ